MKKTLIPILAGTLAVFALSGCGSANTLPEDDEQSTTNETIDAGTFSFTDGTKVNCFVSYTRDMLQLDCDWNGAGTEYTLDSLVFDKMNILTSVEEMNGREVRCISVSSKSSFMGDLECDVN